MSRKARLFLFLSAFPLLWLLACATPAEGQQFPASESASDDAAVDVAIGHLRNLEYDEARAELTNRLADNPGDLRAWHYLGVATLYEEMYRRGVLESKIYGEGGSAFKASKVDVSPEFQKELLGILDRGQAAALGRLTLDKSDKDAMYWLGAIHGTRATYHFALRKEYKAALHEATDAYNLHRDLLKLDPGYIDAYLIVGVNNYVVGSLPWFWKFVASLGGRSGDKKEGLRQVKRVTEEGNYARADAKLMLAVLYQREKRPELALKLFQELAQASPRNHLLRLEVGALQSRLQDWQAAAATYDDMIENYRAAAPGFTAETAARAFYLAGMAQQHLTADDKALAYYGECARLTADGYIPRCELAAADLLSARGEPARAREKYERVIALAPGTEHATAARKALDRFKD